MNQEYRHIRHEFEPVYDEQSRILILGTLPSVKSREQHFYYGHPQNRFWKVLARIFGQERPPVTIEEKKAFLLRHKIAVWDVIAECDIIGSSDSSIKNVIPADIGRILEEAPIEAVYANGEKAYQLYMKYLYPVTNAKICKLPSTSPANAAFGPDRLAQIWGAHIGRACREETEAF
ncbi:MAG: DNA-deoxyinosine glycosylase [Roseburia sp.]|nr:DNA-deoxyinosine glycosylase [Roseburia sp.]